VRLGLTIFTLAFVLIGLIVGPDLLRRADVKDVSLVGIEMGTTRIDLGSADALMQKRCARCHDLDRVVGARKDARGWLATVNRMRALPSSGISDNDARTILSFLVAENSIDTSNAQGELVVGRAIVDSRCNNCHALDRTYSTLHSPDQWKSTVERMVRYAQNTGGFFKTGESEQIIRFLSATQSPGTVERRPSDSVAPGTSGVKRSGAAAPSFWMGGSMPALAVVMLLIGASTTLALRRPKSSHEPLPGPALVEQPQGTPLNHILELVRIHVETNDCVTLRFRVPEMSRFRARPGQFLSFHWLIAGRSLTRCYSISSSPTQSAYIEITVRKQSEDGVSAFLNERATAGLTVEVQGPFGEFFFDENRHKRVVFIAGGSGITLM
jgi:hypothetical protein